MSAGASRRDERRAKQRILALLFDLGDTLMVEESEIRDTEGTTLRADLIPGMAKVLRLFKAQGYGLALVADARKDTPLNVLRQHNLDHLFDCLSISEVVGAEKPAPPVFRAALDGLGIPESDHGRVAMVGNNLERDVAGANRLGLISIFFHWNERRRTRPLTGEETPRYTVSSAQELVALVASLARSGQGESARQKGEKNGNARGNTQEVQSKGSSIRTSDRSGENQPHP